MNNESSQQFDNVKKVSPEKHETSVDTIDAIGNDHHAVLTTILKERPVKTWSRKSLHLYAVCLLIYLCSTMNGLPTPDCSLRFVVLTDSLTGYDGSLMGSINAVPSYTAYYNLPPEGNSGTGLVFAIFQIGQMVGALFCWVADWHGRRWPIFIGCLGTCLGGVVTSVAPTIPAFIGGRFMLSFFSTIATVAAPIYLIEIAPPQHRGTVAGLYNTLYYLVRALTPRDLDASNGTFD
jgi:MFS family permease